MLSQRHFEVDSSRFAVIAVAELETESWEVAPAVVAVEGMAEQVLEKLAHETEQVQLAQWLVQC